MKTLMTYSTKRLLIAAVVALAPASSALAAGECAGDPFAAYNQAFYGEGPAYTCTAAAEAGARGPAGPMMISDDRAACRSDPHHRIQQVLWADGPSYECAVAADEQAGAHGRAGPTMAEELSAASDPFYRLDQVFIGD